MVTPMHVLVNGILALSPPRSRVEWVQSGKRWRCVVRRADGTRDQAQGRTGYAATGALLEKLWGSP